jgi:HEAT repeat protein
MKSTKKQLEERGFIPDEELNRYMDISDDELLQLLNSSRAYDRTAGANITKIRREEKHLPLLCELLKNENKILRSEAERSLNRIADKEFKQTK